jgi:DNA-binding transcriptional LysR family regulator
MNLLYLKYFYEVARAGSVTEGARRLRVSQPAVSKMIRALEADLGAPLLERRARGVALTAEGTLAFERASRIFAEARALSEDLRQEAPRLKGEWCVGASDTFALHVLPDPLAAMKRLHPGLRISLFAGTSTHIKEELIKDRCDLGLFFTLPGPREPLDAAPLLQTEFWIVAAPSLGPKPRGRVGKPGALKFKDLKNLPRIESRHADYATGFPAHFHSSGLGLTEAPFLEVNNHEVKKRLALGGHGYALLIRESVQDEVRKGRLARIIPPKPLGATLYRVTRKGRPPGRASREFLALLQEAARAKS